MEFRILGPLEVLVDAKPLPPLGPKQGAILALLLLHANEVVSADRLVDELWSQESRSAGAALQASISRLRKGLGTGARTLETSGSGYVLRLEPGQLDLHVFEGLVDRADGEEPAAAAETLREALALWRGGALADFSYDAFAQQAIARLEELRLLALERKIAADLARGRDAELVPELEALIAEHPLRERLRAQLMLALYRAGRQAEALDAYQATRRALVDELGIEPGPALQELEVAILRQDPTLDLEPVRPELRSILAIGLGEQALHSVRALAEPLSQRPVREVIVSRLVEERDALERAADEVNGECRRLAERGIVARSAVFTTSTPGVDAVRLAAEQNVDLVLVPATPDLLDDGDLVELLRAAPCDVAVVIGDAIAPGPVLVPFAGADHDWSAIELGSWLARSWQMPVRIAGPAVAGGRDASRLLARASLAVQRALGVTVEPLLLEPGPAALAATAKEMAVAVAGLSDRWQKEGLGPVRSALAASGTPTLLVRKGLRPGGLAAPENQTRFTWSIKAG